LKERLQDQAAGAKERFRGGASRVGQKAAEAVDSGRGSAAQGLHSTARSLRSVADRMPSRPKVQQFATRAADRLEDGARYLREKPASDIWTDIQGQTRNRPTAFLLGALATGFLAGRLLRRR
jgi:hypothetical protein